MKNFNKEQIRKLCRKGIGKVKGHRIEYGLFEQMMDEPYPMVLTDEHGPENDEPIPIEKAPDVSGWLYFHLEGMHPQEPIIGYDLAKSLAKLHKIQQKVWKIVNDEGVRQMPIFDEDIHIIEYFDRAIEEIGMEVGENGLTYDQARTLIHYFRFEEPDYPTNYWEDGV